MNVVKSLEKKIKKVNNGRGKKEYIEGKYVGDWEKERIQEEERGREEERIEENVREKRKEGGREMVWVDKHGKIHGEVERDNEKIMNDV